MDQSFQKGIRKGAHSCELANCETHFVDCRFISLTVAYLTNVLSLRITLWSLRNAETYPLNITGNCGRRQVTCTFILLHPVRVSHYLMVGLRSHFNSNSGGNEEGGRNKAETTGKVYHEQVSHSSYILGHV